MQSSDVWVLLPAGCVHLGFLFQTLDGGLNVIQLETAVGAAIKSFENSLGINVPRSRFLPVKTTSDLLLVMSNLYSLNAGSLTMSEKREFPTVPLVKLGSSFTKVNSYRYALFLSLRIKTIVHSNTYVNREVFIYLWPSGHSFLLFVKNC